MTATYTNQPGTVEIDTVRFEIDDKDTTPETDALLTDEEIQYLIDTTPHILLAAAAAADAVGAKYSDSPVSKKVGDLTIDYGDATGIAGSYAALSKSLRLRAVKTAVGAKLYSGGMSKSEKATVAADADRVQVEVSVGMDDHPGTDSDY